MFIVTTKNAPIIHHYHSTIYGGKKLLYVTSAVAISPSDKLLCLVGGWKQKKGEVVSGYLVRKLCNILGPVWVRLRLKLIGSRHTQLPQRHTCNNVSNALYFSLCCIILIFLMVGAVSSHSSWSVLSPSRDMYICMYFLSIMQKIKEKKVFIQQETFLTK